MCCIVNIILGHLFTTLEFVPEKTFMYISELLKIHTEFPPLQSSVCSSSLRPKTNPKDLKLEIIQPNKKVIPHHDPPRQPRQKFAFNLGRGMVKGQKDQFIIVHWTCQARRQPRKLGEPKTHVFMKNRGESQLGLSDWTIRGRLSYSHFSWTANMAFLLRAFKFQGQFHPTGVYLAGCCPPSAKTEF